MRVPPPPLQHKEASAKEREIKRNLRELLRRQNSVAETKIFTKFSGTHEAICRCHVSLACVTSVSVWFWRKERPGNGIFGFGRARNGATANFRTVFDSRSETARKRLLRRLRVAASVTYTSATFVSRLKFMIIVPSMER